VFVGLTFLPLLLVIVGGLIGGLFGVLTSSINLAISRRHLSWPLKLAAMLGVTVLGAVLYFVVAFAISPIPTLATGTCLNGVHVGAEVTTGTTRPVDCAVAHENEVVGSVLHPGDGAYPGQQAIFDYSQTPCMDAFAAYVGVDFQASVLEMIVITPTDLTWIKGDRAVACVVLLPNAEKLTGSVRGTAR
jgi:hypothetical protein